MLVQLVPLLEICHWYEVPVMDAPPVFHPPSTTLKISQLPAVPEM